MYRCPEEAAEAGALRMEPRWDTELGQEKRQGTGAVEMVCSGVVGYKHLLRAGVMRRRAMTACLVPQ